MHILPLLNYRSALLCLLLPYSTIAIASNLDATTPLDVALIDKLPPLTVNTIPQNNSLNLGDEVLDWSDNRHEDVQENLDKLANQMNGWFGKPDPSTPASANLRVVLDTRWEDDPVSGSHTTVEPRIRGRLRLPVLEERISLIIGDEALDEEITLQQDATGKAYAAQTINKDKVLDSSQVREVNASIALRWSQFDNMLEDKLNVNTDIDVGVRSVDDVYLKVNVNKSLYQSANINIDSNNFYRYGIDSKHYARAELITNFGSDKNLFVSNVSKLRYQNDSREVTDWSNDIRRIHYLNGNKQLSYGLFASGDIKGDNDTLNSYGPVISYRQPLWRKWLFAQTELNYYNDKAENKDHYPSALLRLEALF